MADDLLASYLHLVNPHKYAAPAATTAEASLVQQPKALAVEEGQSNSQDPEPTDEITNEEISETNETEPDVDQGNPTSTTDSSTSNITLSEFDTYWVEELKIHYEELYGKAAPDDISWTTGQVDKQPDYFALKTWETIEKQAKQDGFVFTGTPFDSRLIIKHKSDKSLSLRKDQLNEIFFQSELSWTSIPLNEADNQWQQIQADAAAQGFHYLGSPLTSNLVIKYHKNLPLSLGKTEINELFFAIESQTLDDLDPTEIINKKLELKTSLSQDNFLLIGDLNTPLPLLILPENTASSMPADLFLEDLNQLTPEDWAELNLADFSSVATWEELAGLDRTNEAEMYWELLLDEAIQDGYFYLGHPLGYPFKSEIIIFQALETDVAPGKYPEKIFSHIMMPTQTSWEGASLGDWQLEYERFNPPSSPSQRALYFEKLIDKYGIYIDPTTGKNWHQHPWPQSDLLQHKIIEQAALKKQILEANLLGQTSEQQITTLKEQPELSQLPEQPVFPINKENLILFIRYHLSQTKRSELANLTKELGINSNSDALSASLIKSHWVNLYSNYSSLFGITNLIPRVKIHLSSLSLSNLNQISGDKKFNDENEEFYLDLQAFSRNELEALASFWGEDTSNTDISKLSRSELERGLFVYKDDVSKYLEALEVIPLDPELLPEDSAIDQLKDKIDDYLDLLEAGTLTIGNLEQASAFSIGSTVQSLIAQTQVNDFGEALMAIDLEKINPSTQNPWIDRSTIEELILLSLYSLSNNELEQVANLVYNHWYISNAKQKILEQVKKDYISDVALEAFSTEELVQLVSQELDLELVEGNASRATAINYISNYTASLDADQLSSFIASKLNLLEINKKVESHIQKRTWSDFRYPTGPSAVGTLLNNLELDPFLLEKPSGTQNFAKILQSTPSTQTVWIQDQVIPLNSNAFSIALRYSASDFNQDLPGLNFNLHYNSKLLTPTSIANHLNQGDINPSDSDLQTLPDDLNLDNNASTDKYIPLAWLNKDEGFIKGSTSSKLATVHFELNIPNLATEDITYENRETRVSSDGISRFTEITIKDTINISHGETSAKYSFVPTSTSLEIKQLISQGIHPNAEAEYSTQLMIAEAKGLQYQGPVFNRERRRQASNDHDKYQQPFSLDIDGDGILTALGDGVIIMRALSGTIETHDDLTNQALGRAAIFSSNDIYNFLFNRDFGVEAPPPWHAPLDVDQDGQATADDGLMIARYLMGPGFRGTQLTDIAIGTESPYFGQTNAWEAVVNNIDALVKEAELL